LVYIVCMSKNAVIFSSWCPTEEEFAIASSHWNAIMSNYSDCDIYVGVNPPLHYSWLELLKKSGPNVFIEIVPFNLAVDSDASAFLHAVNAYRRSGMQYDKVFIGHTKGVNKKNIRDAQMIIERFWNQRSAHEQILDLTPEMGAVFPFSCFLTEPCEALKPHTSAFHSAFPMMAAYSVFTMRGDIFHQFAHSLKEEFFTKNLVTELGFDRWFVERDFAAIPSMYGKFSLPLRIFGHQQEPADIKRLQTEINAWGTDVWRPSLQYQVAKDPLFTYQPAFYQIHAMNLLGEPIPDNIEDLHRQAQIEAQRGNVQPGISRIPMQGLPPEFEGMQPPGNPPIFSPPPYVPSRGFRFPGEEPAPKPVTAPMASQGPVGMPPVPNPSAPPKPAQFIPGVKPIPVVRQPEPAAPAPMELPDWASEQINATPGAHYAPSSPHTPGKLLSTYIENKAFYNALTDKGDVTHCYIQEFYDEFFENIKPNFKMIEIGTYKGGGIKLWSAAFPQSFIYGVDMNPLVPFNEWNGHNYQIMVKNAYTEESIGYFKEIVGLADVIIDDGSHNEKDQLWCLEHYYDLLAPGGSLIIEDVVSMPSAIMMQMKYPDVQIVDLRNKHPEIYITDNILVIRTKPV
jgi:hypothetical protein